MSSSSRTTFEAEIREQPEVLARLLQAGRPAAEQIAAAIRRRAPAFALLAARGSSDNAARYGQYLLGAQHGLVAALAAPSLITQYEARPALQSALVIGISQSGQSPDIVAVLDEGRRQGGVCVAITNDPGSPLARAAEFVLPQLAGDERAVAATKTYSTQLMALAMLSASLSSDERLWAALEQIPAQVEAALALNASTPDAAASFRTHERLVVVGRGFDLATVLELTLKIKETSGVMADGYSSADFHHGPKALLESRIPLLAVAPGPHVFEELDALLELARSRRAPLIAISDRPEVLGLAGLQLPSPAGVPGWLSPLVTIVPGQLFALGLSVARGGQPDAPAGLSKVTHTR